MQQEKRKEEKRVKTSQKKSKLKENAKEGSYHIVYTSLCVKQIDRRESGVGPNVPFYYFSSNLFLF
jgi:hypothetical protein